MTYGPFTITCSLPWCADHLAFDFTTTRLANRAARARGWTVSGVQPALCPVHREAVGPAPGTPETRLPEAPRGRPRPPRFDDATEKRIAEQYARGLGTSTLARRWGRSPQSIRNIVLRQGGTMRACGTRDGKR